jgi:chromosomal replication initiation ATPase DnaA
MAELTAHTVSPLFARSFGVQPGCAAQELIEPLETALHRITEVGTGAAAPVVRLAHRSLAALARIRTDGRLTNIAGQIERDFRLRPRDLQSRSREQPIAFLWQLAMFPSRKITGAPLDSIGEHFNRDQTTVIHTYQLIERRIRLDAAFQQFIEKMEARMTGIVPLTVLAV